MHEKPLGIYVHIPFCVRKCLYCDFLSAPAVKNVQERYVETLLAEIEQAGDFSGYHVKTIFFGGGTPTLLTAEQLSAVLEKLRERFYFENDEPEVTLEVNPATADFEKLRALREAGFNRISIGIQSLQNEELKRLGRIHSAEEGYQIIKEAREAGFTNMNVDLMTGIPGQTVESLSDSLQKLIALSPEHISAYSLIVEEGTPFERLYPGGAVDEETDRRLYHLTGRMLSEAGYSRYEISNYAKPGYECRHNSAYWTRRDYLGLGLGAASLLEHTRFSVTRDLERYLSGKVTREQIEQLSLQDEMAETMFLGLRLTAGISYADFYRIFGRELEEIYGDEIRKHMAEGLLQKQNSCLRLTERGMDIANYVMADFLA